MAILEVKEHPKLDNQNIVEIRDNPAPRSQEKKRSKTYDEITKVAREELKKQREGSHTEDDEWLRSLVQTSFSRKIFVIGPPFRINFSSFGLFYGTSDWRDHIVRYHDTMMTLGISKNKQ